MTCKATGDPAPTSTIYVTNSQYWSRSVDKTSFDTYGTKTIFEVFPSAIVDASENGSKITLTLEKQKVYDKLESMGSYETLGIGCVGQNKYSHSYEFKYYTKPKV